MININGPSKINAISATCSEESNVSSPVSPSSPAFAMGTVYAAPDSFGKGASSTGLMAGISTPVGNTCQ